MVSRFSDTFSLLSRITPRRMVNLLLLYFSYYAARTTGKVRHRGKPFTVSIEPTTSCNLRCPECPSGLRQFTRPTGALSLELYRDIIDQLSPGLFYLILYFQGEPFLNPLFFKMVEYARRKRIYTATSTNAHFLNDNFARKTVESGLDRIIISLDGLDQESYEKYRTGGSVEKVFEGTRNLVRWKKELKSRTPYIILQFIVFSTNEHQVGELKKVARELGVDKLELKTAQVYNYEDGNDLIPSNPDYARYKKENGKFKIDNPLNNHCLRMWRGCVITWDGLVVPCCFDKDGSHRMGDLKINSFDEIWRGKAYDDFRRKLFTARSEIDICKNCTEK
ncbi:MAG TPA: SPASM domain-containing protein [Bacteroidales bacterium]|nr:SPASM domain-containing protein [Bacteroidales bacterium]HOX79169.1 SPASM domain-containing protein [Bacteroidales bacterium]HPI85001.1 SPASM domain-containing protein [Bacteroidales bacterium]HPM92420.1 SPASM domain-containing protein [Bacteroidales bacterium]